MQDAAKYGSNRKSPEKNNIKSEKLLNNSNSKVNKKVLNKITDRITEEDRIECEPNNIVLNDLNANHSNVKNHSEVPGNHTSTPVSNAKEPDGTELSKENHVKPNTPNIIDVNHKESPSSNERSKRKRIKSKCNCESKECSCSQSGDDDTSPRQLKSGHSRTRAIVINLDDKNRFTEEVTV